MSTTIRTTSEKQMNQIRRFAKMNKGYSTITLENEIYNITLFGLSSSAIEKFIKDFIKTNRLSKVQSEPHACAA